MTTRRARACPRARRSDATELEARETYLLPGPAAEQGLRAVSLLLRPRRVRVAVDLGTGPGVLGQRARLVYPGARLVGVEVRAEEARAARHYDSWICANYLAPDFEAPCADIVMSNPGFSATVPTVEFALDRVLRPGGIMLLFARKTWGESSEAAELIMRRPPLHSWLVHRRLSMSLHEEGTDNCCHVWWVWRCGDDPRRESWTSRLLPPLPGPWCDWTTRPGDEDDVVPLPPEYWPAPENHQHA